MFHFLFKFILLPVLVILVAVTAAAAYLLLTSVDEDNVRSRIWQACLAASGIQAVNNMSRRPPRPVYSPAQCDCASDKVVMTLTPAVSVIGAEAVRSLLEDGVRSWLSGQKHDMRRTSQRNNLADAFVSTASRVSRPCGEQ